MHALLFTMPAIYVLSIVPIASIAIIGSITIARQFKFSKGNVENS